MKRIANQAVGTAWCQDRIRRQAKIEVTGGCFDFDPKIKKRKCLDFLKKLKIIKDFFFGIALPKKNMFFMKKIANQAVVPPVVKTSKDRSDWGLF
jgi:hypothetical protein